MAAYRDVDTKAIEVMKFGEVILAIVAAGAGALARAETDLLPLWPVFVTSAGLLAVIISVITAAYSYTASTLMTGLTSFGEAARTKDLTLPLSQRFILDVYDSMIEENKLTIERKARGVDWSIGILILGLFFSGIGAVGLLMWAA